MTEERKRQIDELFYELLLAHGEDFAKKFIYSDNAEKNYHVLDREYDYLKSSLGKKLVRTKVILVVEQCVWPSNEEDGEEYVHRGVNLEELVYDAITTTLCNANGIRVVHVEDYKFDEATNNMLEDNTNL